MRVLGPVVRRRPKAFWPPARDRSGRVCRGGRPAMTGRVFPVKSGRRRLMEGPKLGERDVGYLQSVGGWLVGRSGGGVWRKAVSGWARRARNHAGGPARLSKRVRHVLSVWARRIAGRGLTRLEALARRGNRPGHQSGHLGGSGCNVLWDTLRRWGRSLRPGWRRWVPQKRRPSPSLSTRQKRSRQKSDGESKCPSPAWPSAATRMRGRWGDAGRFYSGRGVA